MSKHCGPDRGRSSLLLILTAAMVFGSCIAPKAPAEPTPTPVALQCPLRANLEIVDATGSQTKEMVRKNIDTANAVYYAAARPCDTYLSAILDERVFTPDSVDVLTSLPGPPMLEQCIHPAGPFSVDESEDCLSRNQARTNEFYGRFDHALSTPLFTAAPEPAGWTPVYGAFAVGCEILRAYGSANTRVLAIWTDLENTAGEPVSLNCQGVDIVVAVSVQTAEQFEAAVQSWKPVLEASGASSTKFLHAASPAEAIVEQLPPGLAMPDRGLTQDQEEGQQ